MIRLPTDWGLPLLAKELTEQSARKRTYGVRAVYASLLFVATWLLFNEVVSRASSFAVFAPAMTCGIITYEKERASLQLLFLTKLGPWTIVLEKFFSRLIPIFGFLLMSLPLLAYAYSLGGITPRYLAGGVWWLFISAVQMAALGLVCSTFCRTTAAAFVTTYLIAALELFGPAFCSNLVDSQNTVPHELRYAFYAPVLHFDLTQSFVATSNWQFLGVTALRSYAIFSSIVVTIVLSRIFLIRRAFAPPRNLAMSVLQYLDQFFVRLNDNKWTKGIVLMPDRGSLPENEPIKWRETTKRSLGRMRYLVRMFVLVEAPLLVYCAHHVISDISSGNTDSSATTIVFFLWGISALLICVQGASLIAREKTQQSLEVLCTTPLSTNEIIQQKFAALTRLMIVLAVPLGTMFVFQQFFGLLNPSNNYNAARLRESCQSGAYFVGSITTACIYLPMMGWLSFWIGLAAKSQGRAIVTTLAVLVGWAVLPFICIVFPLELFFRHTQQEILAVVMHFSPLTQILVNEFGPPFGSQKFSGYWPVVVNGIAYLTIALVFRQICRVRAAHYLQRNEGQSEI